MLVALYMNYQDKTNNKKERNMENTMDINYHISQVYEIATSMGIKNPFDKYKFRELQVGSLLGHTVFEGASNGGSNDSTFGADAHEADGSKADYNGAYSVDSIERYKDCNHYFSLHYKGDVVAIVKVDTDYVINTLMANNQKREERTRKMIEEGRTKLPTTNCNSVTVEVVENNPLITFVYKNEEYFV